MAEERGLRIGSFAGAAIVVDSTILILAAYVLGTALLNQGVGALPGALSFLIAVMLAVLLHEFGHAGVAALLKLKSERIVLTFFGGHVEFAEQPKSRWEDVLVLFSGPAANLATAAILLPLVPALAERSSPEGLTLYALTFLGNLAYVSALLGAFNLLPGFPLDGGRILKALLSYGMRENMARVIAGVCGIVLALGLIGYAIWAQTWWTGAIGALLAIVAWAEVRQARSELKAQPG